MANGNSSSAKHPEDYERRRRGRKQIRAIQDELDVNYTTALRLWEAGWSEMNEAQKQEYYAKEQ